MKMQDNICGRILNTLFSGYFEKFNSYRVATGRGGTPLWTTYRPTYDSSDLNMVIISCCFYLQKSLIYLS